jgi:hypothetical protein
VQTVRGADAAHDRERARAFGFTGYARLCFRYVTAEGPGVAAALCSGDITAARGECGGYGDCHSDGGEYGNRAGVG